jgi:hypothetical protein
MGPTTPAPTRKTKADLQTELDRANATIQGFCALIDSLHLAASSAPTADYDTNLQRVLELELDRARNMLSIIRAFTDRADNSLILEPSYLQAYADHIRLAATEPLKYAPLAAESDTEESKS